MIAKDLGGRIRLEVRNRGAPIPANAMHNIFEPLRRADGKRQNGTRRNLGIGLFVVREIARAHGGSVGVENADGEVVFWMELRKKPAA